MYNVYIKLFMKQATANLTGGFYSKLLIVLGLNWNYEHPSEIFDEMASLTPFFGSSYYDVLEGWDSFFWGSKTGD